MTDKQKRLKKITLLFPLVMELSKEQRDHERHIKENLHTIKLDTLILLKKEIDLLGAKIKGYVIRLNKLGLKFDIEDLRK